MLNLLEIERQTDGENQIYIEQLFLGAIKVNLSYLKGSQTYEYLLASQRNLEQTLTGLVAPKLHEKCDVFTAWSQHTYDEDRLAEDQGKSHELRNLSFFKINSCYDLINNPIVSMLY